MTYIDRDYEPDWPYEKDELEDGTIVVRNTLTDKVESDDGKDYEYDRLNDCYYEKDDDDEYEDDDDDYEYESE